MFKSTTMTPASLIGRSEDQMRSAFIPAWASNAVTAVRQRSADRALRRQLETMDDVLLRDIGLNDDEIWQVRHGVSVQPNSWSRRSRR